MLTRYPNSAYNVPVLTKKVSIGIGTPTSYTGARRLSICRLRGFFVRSCHLYGEACGRLRAGRFLCNGSSNPQRLATPLGTGREAPKTQHRSLAMQAIPSNVGSEPTYNITFVLHKIATNSLSREDAKLFADTFRIEAQSLLAVIPDSAGRPVQTLANPYDIVSAIQTTSGLLEAADYLETLAKNKGN